MKSSDSFLAGVSMEVVGEHGGQNARKSRPRSTAEPSSQSTNANRPALTAKTAT